MTPEMRDALRAVGHAVSFDDGQTLRQKGAFAPDMLLITQGQVDCILSDTDAVQISVGPDTIVGEIGFLTGQGATATLLAKGPVEALSLDASALQRLQQKTPAIAADVLRHLATLIQDRSAQNEGLLAGAAPDDEDTIEVVRCSTLDQRRTAQRLRYDVHCLENGRESAFADYDEEIIHDDLDAHGTSFLAVQMGQPIGMIRMNLGRDDLKMMPALLGLSHTPFSADDSAFVTATALREAHRSDLLFAKLFTALTTFAQASGAKAVFANCPPELQPLYVAHGFTRTAPDFVHAEMGLSVPMVRALDEIHD